MLHPILQPVLQPVLRPVGGVRRVAPWYSRRDVATVVLIGDSLTSDNGQTGTGSYQYSTHANGLFTWANALADARFTVIKNSGVGGQNSAQILARFSTDVVAYAPRVVVIMAGTNDTGSAAETIANLQSMYEQAETARIYVYALTTPWAPGHSTEKLEKISAINEWIESYASTRQWIKYVDVYSAVEGNTAYFRDSVHFNPRGAHAAGTALAPYLAEWGQPFVLPSAPVDSARWVNTDPLLTSEAVPFTHGTFSGMRPGSLSPQGGAATLPAVASVLDVDSTKTLHIEGGNSEGGTQTVLRLYPAPANFSVPSATGFRVALRFRIVSNNGGLGGISFGSSNGARARAFVVLPTGAETVNLPTETTWLTVVSPVAPANDPETVQTISFYGYDAGSFAVEVQRLGIEAIQ